ncbi:MAG: glycosyltransferase family 4 protein [Polaromonas sp.]|nr:glycosyltransferase family 4 protein [Polaromonas sp.]
MSKKVKTVIVTNAPAPYRVPGWRILSETEDISLNVIYCTKPHIDINLDFSEHGFPIFFLKSRYYVFDKRFLHFDLSIWNLLNKICPDVVITTGFIPTYLIAFAWSVIHKVPHVVMSDGTAQSEKSLSWFHRMIRRLVYSRSVSFIGACEGSRTLFHQYLISDERIHLSYLCIKNDRFIKNNVVPNFDFIFCSRFIQHKRPIFALQVAREVAICLGRKTSIQMVGTGNMLAEVQAFATQITDLVDTYFCGYVKQNKLPNLYLNSRIFLFPTEWDPWGVVANEACAAGLPVIVSPYAGVAGELVLDGVNGYVLDLNVELWSKAAVSLLVDDNHYAQFSKKSLERVAKYSFENAANGLSDAIKQASILNFKNIS